MRACVFCLGRVGRIYPLTILEFLKKEIIMHVVNLNVQLYMPNIVTDKCDARNNKNFSRKELLINIKEDRDDWIILVLEHLYGN